MFFEPKLNDHGLPHNPIKALVTPRPIGWISTLSKDGVPNLAPYSFFNLISHDPYMVAFSSGMKKDSARNAEETGEFVYNFASSDFVDQISLSSALSGPEVNEFETAGLEMASSRVVSAPRVAGAHAHLECRYERTVELPWVDNGKEIPWYLVIGSVVGVHIEDRFIKDGFLDTKSLDPLSRLGYMDYGKLGEVFSKERPDEIGNMS